MTAELHTDSRVVYDHATEDVRRGRLRLGRASGQRLGAKTGDEVAPETVRDRRARRRLRRGWRSPLTRRILLVNVLVLVIPVFGLLHLDQYRQTLIVAALEGLTSRGQAFALSLGNSAVVTDERGAEALQTELTRHLMRLLLTDGNVRARAFAQDGTLIADSFVLVGPGGQVQVEELPPPDDGSLASSLGEFYDQVVTWFPGLDELPKYDELALYDGTLLTEVALALDGEPAGMARLRDGRRLVLSAAVPIQRYRQVLGALLLSKDGAEVTASVYDRRSDILMVFAVAFAVTVLLSLYLAGALARPIRRLAAAADQVRSGKGRRLQIPDFTRRDDEIGDLSGALREMTATLWARMDAIEGFAADVAHEIKNPLTSLRSAVETVARLEDPEQQKKLMTIILDDVQRLDRLISDISSASRLDAELSRAESEAVDLVELVEALKEVQEATVGDQGPVFELDLPRRGRIVVPGLEGRLGQVFRNLIANAVSFSPPGGVIRLKIERHGPWAVVRVDDQGPGLPDGKEEAVFDRFYSERPKGEKFGTHSGLGLSISRQIVEAHGGTIRAENRYDRSGTVIGARFIVRLPGE